MHNLRLLDAYRVRDRAVWEMYGGFGDETCGVFDIPSPIDRQLLRIVAMVQQATCACGCGTKLGRLTDTEFHHRHELALGGEDAPENIVAVRAECHARITNGTRATSYGSSKHIIAKAKRLARVRPEFQAKVLAKPCGAKRERSGRWPAGRKIPSRPFPRSTP